MSPPLFWFAIVTGERSEWAFAILDAARSSPSAEFRCCCARRYESKEGQRCEGGARKERNLGTKTLPQRTGKHARNKQRKAAKQVEHPKRGATQLRRSSVGYQRRKQSLREAHVQSPQGNTDGHTRKIVGKREHEV